MTIPFIPILFEQEEGLIKGCQEGNAQAQKVLYNQYVEQLMLVCLRYANNKEDAKDMLMQGMAECFRSIKSLEYRGEGSLRAWLKKVVVNQCLMHLRKLKLAVHALDDSLEDYLPGDQDSPDVQLSVKEIMLYINELPPGYRTVFNLYVFEDLGHKEIAEMLGITESTSKTQLHKARAILKNKITRSQKIAL